MPGTTHDKKRYDKPMESWLEWLAVAPTGAYIAITLLLWAVFAAGAWLA